MAPFPLPLAQLFGLAGANLLFILIGIAFGATLEMAGFGNSNRLAAQFYFKDQTVFKVMFLAIVVAMLLIFAASGIGLLDFNQVWVNPTYLLPGIVGGLIMGVGFIIGGFCPGTSLVAAVTGKIDGILFSLGALFGMFLFGETVGLFDEFWHSSYMGRFTLPDLLGLPVGVVALLVVLMALFAFWGAEQLERIIGKKDLKQAPRWRYGAAGIAVAAGLTLVVVGQPTTADRWERIAPARNALLEQRAVQIHPGELLSVMHNDLINLVMFDVRDEADYNRFHLLDAEHVPLAKLPERIAALYELPPNTVVVVMSNDETAATEAWRVLQAESVRNAYILEGGVNGWLDTFASDEFKAQHQIVNAQDDGARYAFAAANGAHDPAANPDPEHFALTFEEKVKLEAVGAGRSGGCG